MSDVEGIRADLTLGANVFGRSDVLAMLAEIDRLTATLRTICHAADEDPLVAMADHGVDAGYRIAGKMAKAALWADVCALPLPAMQDRQRLEMLVRRGMRGMPRGSDVQEWLTAYHTEALKRWRDADPAHKDHLGARAEILGWLLDDIEGIGGGK